MKKSLFTAFAVGLCMTANLMAQVPSYVPTNGLVGWWPFNGNANDESGNGNNGSVTGANLTYDRNNVINSAYSFDGIGDYIDCGNSNFVNITGDITISAWINANNFSIDHGIVSKSGLYDLVTSAPFTQPPLDNLRWNAGNVDFLFFNPIPENQWIHAVVSYSNTNGKSIYLNSVLSANNLLTGNVQPNTNYNLYLGAHQPTIVNYWSWDGKLDDIGIWNRALTQQEITDLYNATNLGMDNLLGDDLKIYPNPSNDYITIDAGNLSSTIDYRIKIEDVHGQEVFQSAINQQQFNVDLSKWSGNGLYFVHLIDPQNNIVTVRKIVLQ
jgi:hypothetical protein